MAAKDYPSAGKQRTGMLESGKIATYVRTGTESQAGTRLPFSASLVFCKKI